MEAYYTTEKDKDGLHVTYADGYNHTLTGARAKAMGTDPEDVEWQIQNPTLAAANRYGHNDDRNSIARDIGRVFGNMAEIGEPNKFFNRGAATGALAGGGIGMLTGAGLSGLYNMFADEGNQLPTGHLALASALAGAILGGMNADVRRRADEKDPNFAGYRPKEASFNKEAAMYRDPRNFILEKLQSANDVSLGQKATLAAKVRAMSQADADRLAKAVRAAVGFGVGALIAKFFFGTGMIGSALGGLVGLAGYNALSSLLNNQAPINLKPVYGPITYRDLL